MRRCLLLAFILSASLFLSAGCDKEPPQVALKEPATEIETTAMEPDKDDRVIPIEPEERDPAQFEKIAPIEFKFHSGPTDRDVLALVNDGYERHGAILYPWYAASVVDDSQEWYVLRDEYDTFEDMITYLAAAYTTDIALMMATKYRHRHTLRDGRYYLHRNEILCEGPRRTGYDWLNAQIKAAYESEDGTVRRYAVLAEGYSGSCSEDEDAKPEEPAHLFHLVELCLGPDGWRLNTVIKQE